ncbi:hypothetical protein ARTHRO9V_130058 [Arthrobacter sp. 9V]|nr:hypothetical protein ARTHRO9V_130058 [Arthrobacter sp. 9V]
MLPVGCAGTAVPPHLPEWMFRPLITAVTGLPVRFYWAQATLQGSVLFFRKLTGDGRVKAAPPSLASVRRLLYPRVHPVVGVRCVWWCIDSRP